MAKIGLITVSDSRPDFFETRKALVIEEMGSLEWLRNEFNIIESEIITAESSIAGYADRFNSEQIDCLIIHLPIWADPILSVKVCNYIKQPVLLLGNGSSETSSLVGVLGAGGALDQIGREHTRVFHHNTEAGRNKVRAFIRAASAIKQLRGNVLGVFGSRSLGIFTTVSDVAQWQRMFDVDIKYFDESSIVEKAKGIDDSRVTEYKEWLLEQLQSCEYGGLFTPEALDRQIRSYLSLQELVAENHLDFVCNKCQRELSDGYATQCLAHMMLNSTWDISGGKRSTVHACESDTDGALTMKILSLLSGGKATTLMDVRYLDIERDILALANCGAIANDFYCKENQNCGLSSISAVPHAFGAAGGCAFPGIMEEGPVTLARLCRKNGRYWMAIIKGEIIATENGELDSITPQFPKGLIKVKLDQKFLNEFGSNHMHVVRGDYIEELETFCKLKCIEFETWK
ncbi:MAG TPA: hypothetical protein VM577_00270 [Anaerovoracaceae bacterium]|nr:hypothetical protein [Anaerovoracaceae bacterium]